MSTTGDLSLKGLGDYIEKLAQAGVDVDKAVQKALDVGADPILQEMDVRVPKDTHHLESTLGKDGPYQDGNFSYIKVGVITDDKATAIYGNVQEFGSSSVEAQPYVRPSFKAKKGAAVKAMKGSLEADGML